MTAAIYDYDTGDIITEGLQGCNVCDEAIIIARRLAKERDDTVHLVDDDGEWMVHPDGTTVEYLEPWQSTIRLLKEKGE